MQKQEKSRKPLIIGIIAAVVILAILLILLLTQCTGGQGNESSSAATVDTSTEVPTYQLYWNADRAEYDGKSEAGMSSRMPEEDGYFHVRFILDGEEVVLKVADRKLINAIDVQDVMGLEFDEDGIVIGVINLDDMPLEKIGWQFFVQSGAKTLIKLNSSQSMNGMEVLLELADPNVVYDMSGLTGPKGIVTEAIEMDKVMAVANLAGEITHVFIYERPNFMLTHEGYCMHCDKDVTWYEWVKTDSMPVSAGHYQLQNDIQLTAQPAQQEDAKTCIDLNGKRVDGKSGARCYAMFNAGTTLAIMDTSEEQTGVMAAHGTGDQGMVVWVRYGAFYLYGGTLDASDATSRLNGVAVECGNGKYFYMNGGTIIGGTAKPQQNDKGNWTAGLGGALSIGGKFVMNDGVIKNGYAEAVITAYNTDGTPKTYSRGFGGNIFLSGTGVFEMNGGTISNGRAGNLGGNIYADGAAELTINGGRIEGGTISGKGRNGGSMYLSSKTTTTMNGGVIYGGSSRNAGGNVYLNGTFTMLGGYIGGGTIRDFKTGKITEDAASRNFFNVNGKFSMYGGTIVGGYQAIDTSATDTKETTVLLSGYAKIYQDGSQRNLTLATGGSGVKVVVGKLVDSAKIGVYATTGIFTDPTQEANTDNFVSDIEGADVVYFDKCLALGRVSCICGKSHGTTVSDSHINGCDSEILFWAPWTSTSSVPKTTGNFFLLKDVTTTGQSTIAKGNDVKLDLNGKNITLEVLASTQDGFRLYRADNGAKLTLTDTTDKPGTLQTVMPGDDAVYPGKTTNSNASVKDEDGKIVERVYYTEEEMRTAWKNGNFGMLLWARGGHITVHNGIFDGSNLTGNKTGMVVSVGNNTETDAETGEKTTYYGSLTMYGGTIIGGYTQNNGNINVGAKATMNIYGGTITGGRANVGGNINVDGTLNVYGGTITAGVVDRSAEEVDGGMGGNINIAKGGVMNMSGGVVSNGSVLGGIKGGGHGGNIHVYGTLNATGGVITGGTTSSAGGNIGTIGADSLITLDGVRVTNGTAGSGGNVSVYVRSNKGLYILGDTVISGGYATNTKDTGNGGNVSINLWYNTKDQDQVVVIDGGTIADGKTPGKGGNIYVRNATSDVYTENEETGEKKQTRWKVGLDVTMKSGNITGGVNDSDDRTDKTKQNGGSIFLASNTTFTLEGGTISGGDTSDGGGNIYTNGVVTVKGGTVTGGTQNGKAGASGNIFAVNGTLAASGGVIDGDVTVTNTKANGSTILLSGTPVINKGQSGGLNAGKYNTDSVPMITIDGVLGEKSVVYVNGIGYVSNETKAENAKYVVSTYGHGVLHYNERLFIGEGYCICGNHTGEHINGCDGTIRAWAPWTSTTALPTTEDNADGHWYLTGDVTIKSGGQQRVGANQHVVLDLNGKTVTGQTNNRVYSTFNEGSNLTITDASEAGNGTIKASNDKVLTDQGGVIWGRYGTITIHNGIFDGSDWNLTNSWTAGDDGVWGTSDDKGSERNGAAISASKLVMYGGTIIGGVCEQYTVEQDGVTYVKAGGSGASVSASNFDMYGGTIKNGVAAYRGGNVYVSGTFNLSGGEIVDGSINKDKTLVGDLAYGGNVYANKMNMSGGTISGGIAYFANGGGLGGNLLVVNTFNATDGTITGGKASTGGNLGVNQTNAKYVLDGVTITDGEAEEGGNIAVNVRAGKSLTITEKTTVSGGKATTDHGGNLYLNIWVANGNTMDITISGEPLTGGTAAADGGQIYLKNTTSGDNMSTVNLTLDGATVSDGTAEGKAGNIFVSKANVVICNNSLVTGGSASNNGGNIYLENGAKVTMTDSTVSDGSVTTTTDKDYHGGNVYVAAGSEFVLDGESLVTNGHAGRRGGNIYVSGTLTIKDGTISGGHTGDCGGNVHVGADGQLVMSGGEITGGFKRVMKADGSYTDSVASHSNVYLVNGDISMSGGEITGAFAIYQSAADRATMTISEDAKITTVTNASGVAYGVTLNNASGAPRPAINVTGTLSDKAEIHMSVDGFVTSTTVEENLDNFYSINKAYNVYFVDADKIHADGFATEDANKIYLGQYHCICGANDASKCVGDCGSKQVLWTKWTSTKALPMTSGYWYLVDGVTTGQNRINNTSSENTLEASDMNIVLDLNGFDVVSNGGRMYNLFADQTAIAIDLTITDTAAEKGTISSTVRSQDQGAIIWGRKGVYDINLYNVTIDGTNLKANAGKYGIVVAGAGEINLYGTTTIIGGTADRGTAIGVEVNSGMYGTLYMDPTVTLDGTIYVSNDAAIDASGLTDASEYVVDASGTFTTGNTITDKAKFFTPDENAASVILVDGQQFAGGQYCICGVDSDDASKHLGDCGNKQLNWRPWRSGTSLPTTSDNWYLSMDVTRSEDTRYTADIVMNLDLNDKTITQSGTGSRLFRVWNAVKQGDNYVAVPFSATISLTNVDKDGEDTTGKIVANVTDGENGTVIWTTQSTHTFNIYGGIIDASQVATKSNGTVAYLSSGSTLNIYGGEIIAGSAAAKDTNGGGIFVDANSTMNMYGGTLRGGKAPGDPSTGWGGYGGNVAVRGTLNMYGGTIKDGQANRGANVCLSNRNKGVDQATLNMYGGTIAGGVDVDNQKDMCVINLYGEPVIDKALTSEGVTAPATSLNLRNSLVVNAEGMTGGRVGVSGSGQFGITLAENGKTVRDCFFSENSGAEIVLHNKTELHFGLNYCLCGASETEGKAHESWCTYPTEGELGWIVWDGKSITESGNYYVPEGGITVTNQVSVTTADIDVNLDLNGQTVKDTAVKEAGRAFAVRNGAHFGITDTSADRDGQIVGNGNKNAAAIHILRSYGSAPGTRETVVNLYAGTVTAEATAGDGGVVGMSGNANGNAVFNMYGGTITGGNATGDGGNVLVQNKSVFNMNAGTISGGTAANGGNVYVQDGGEFYQNGGSITGGTAEDGGNVYIAQGGKFVSKGAETTISDGTATGENVNARGGNIAVMGGELTIDGASVTGGKSVVITSGRYAYAGSIYMDVDTDVAAADRVEPTVTLKNGATVFGGSVNSLGGWAPGGNIYVNYGTLNVETDAKIEGGYNAYSATANTDGNNLYLNYDGVVNLNGGSIVNTFSNKQENIAMQGGTLNIDGGTVKTNDGVIARNIDGNSNAIDNNKPEDKWPTINLYSGSIVGGSHATDNGGNVYLRRGMTLNVMGGEVTGGHAANQGGNIYANGVVNVTGGKIYGGTADKEPAASNIFIVNGTLDVSGGEIDGGINMVNSTGSSKVILSKKPVIKATNGGITMADDIDITMTEALEEGSQVHTSGRGYISGETVEANLDYVTSVPGYNEYYLENKIFLGLYSCLCATPDQHTDGCVAGMKEILGDSYSADAKLPMLPLKKLSNMSSGGYWYLHEGLTSTTTSSATVSLRAGEDLVLNLNGKTLDITQNGRLFTTYKADASIKDASLIITDTSSNEVSKQGKLVLNSTANTTKQGGLIWLASAANRAYILGGTVDASNYKLSNHGGSVVNMGSGGSLYMYNGALKGTATNQFVDGDADGWNGGTVLMSSGNFYLYDGTISGGNAGGAGKGGNVAVTGGTLHMYGGTITDGGNASEGSNLAVTGSATLNMSGGTVAGGLYVESDNVKLSGSTLVISKANTTQAYSLKIASGKLIDVSGLKSGADVSVTAELGAFAKNATADHETIVKSEVVLSGEKVPVVFNGTDSKLYMGQQYCLCGAALRGTDCVDGCDGTVYGWTAWQSGSRLPIETGNYYLTSNVTLANTELVPVAGSTIRIDLRGYTISLADDQNLYEFAASAGVTLVITDSTKNAEGQIVYTGTSQTSGGMFALKSGNTFSLYRATLDASGATLKSTSTAEINGVVAHIEKGATFNIYSGTVIGGTTVISDDNVKKGAGGALSNSGTLNMYGGTIRDGVAANYGGNIANWGTANLFGGTITGGKAPNGGNVGGQGVGVELNTKNVVISNGVATSSGGNIYSFHNGMSGTLGEGTVIVGGTAANGGNVYLHAGNLNASSTPRTMTIDGAQIVGGSATGIGGNVYVNAWYVLEVLDGTVSGGNAQKYAGNIHIANNSKLTISGGSVGGEVTYDGTTYSGGYAPQNGGSIRVEGSNAKFSLSGGELVNGVTDDTGGNVFVKGGATFTMTGGTIKGGIAKTSNAAHEGANLYIQNAKGVISGGEVWGGAAVQNFDSTTAASIELSKDVVIDGTLNTTAIPSLSLWSYASEGKTAAEPDITITGALSETASVGINEADCIIAVAGEFNEASMAQLFADKDGQTILYIGEDFATKYPNYADGGIDPTNDLTKLYIGRVNCVCGNADNHDTDVCDKSTHLWFPTKSRPTINNGGDGVAHYWYLTAGFTHSSSNQSQVNVDGTGVYLDLNGYNITATGTRMYRTLQGDAAAKVTLVLTNTSSTASTITVGNDAHQGRILWLGKNNSTGIVYNINVAISNTAGIGVDDDKVTYNAKEGAAFAVADKCTLMMKKVNFTSASEKMGFNGVFLYVKDANTVATLKDCTMTGAKAKTVQTVWPDQTDYGTTAGGNGGAIYALNATLNLINTSITGNSAETNGGGVYMSGTSVLNVSGSTSITGNTLTDGTANNIYAEANATVNIVETTDSPFTGTIGLAGGEDDPIVSGITSRTDSKVGTRVVLDDSTNYQFMAWSNGLGMTSINNRIQCECGGKAVGMTGHTCVEIVFKPWEKTTSLPNTNGNYYLTAPVITGGQTVIKQDQVVRLDLRGQNVTYQVPTASTDGFRLYRAEYDGELILTDSTAATSDTGYTAGTLKTVITGTSDQQKNGNTGMILWLRGGHAVVYGGILDGSANSGNKKGMTIHMSYETPESGTYDSTLTIYGGQIKGATSSANGPTLYANKSTVTMYGGTISGGTSTAANGGSIYLDGTTVFTMKGGTVEGGTAGYDLTNEMSRQGGNFYVGGGASLYVEGNAIIKDGTATDCGGNIHVAGGKLFVKENAQIINGRDIGFTVSADKTTVTYTNKFYSSNSNVYLVNGSLDMSGGTIDGGINSTTTDTTADLVQISGSAKIGTVNNVDGDGNVTATYGLTLGTWSGSENKDIKNNHITVSGTLNSDCSVAVYAGPNGKNTLDPDVVTGLLTEAEAACFVPTDSTVTQLTVSKTEGAETYQLTQSEAPQQ